MKHLRYASYVIRHKWFVFVECCKLGIPLAGIVHDWSKLLPCEWMPYAEFFYGGAERRNAGGTYKGPPTEHTDFDRAWNHHQKCNPHHWQYWVIFEDSGKIFALDMPLRYRKEMLADWRGAGRAITGKTETAAWYSRNKNKMLLHPATRHWIEDKLQLARSGERRTAIILDDFAAL